MSGGGDYLLQVKGRQKTLYHALTDAFGKHADDPSPVPGLSYAATDEMHRGRHEIRECFMMPGTWWTGEIHEHWIPDVQFGEDRSKSATDHAAENFNLLQHIAYNALRETPELKGNFSNKQLVCLTNNDLPDKAVSHLIAS